MTEQEERTSCVIPIWEKYTLSVQEAAEYFGFSDKKIRKIVYQKYNGHCAYCGCEIPEKGFNVDHLHCLRNYEYDEDIDVHDVSNMMPACGSCNRYKSTMDLESNYRKYQTG